MNFFSGFSLFGEASIFRDYIKESDFSVSGFSLGAIEAFEYVLNTKKRVDTLVLFSPAFFQDRDEKFRRLQSISYKKDPKSYQEQFLKNIAYPSNYDMSIFFKDSDIHLLHKLLNFTWEREKLNELRDRGVRIEVYLGERDKIINSKEAYNFFKNFATVYFIKGVGHTLHGES